MAPKTIVIVRTNKRLLPNASYFKSLIVFGLLVFLLRIGLSQEQLGDYAFARGRA